MHTRRVRTQEVNNSPGRGLWSGGAERWTICRGVGGNAELQLSLLLLMSAATNCDGSSGFFSQLLQLQPTQTRRNARPNMLFVSFSDSRLNTHFGFLASSCGTGLEKTLQRRIKLCCKMRLPAEDAHTLTGEAIRCEALETVCHVATSWFWNLANYRSTLDTFSKRKRR